MSNEPQDTEGIVVIDEVASFTQNDQDHILERIKRNQPAPLTEDRIRELVREQVERELYPGVIDARRYRHINITDADGQRWRGMVYHVEDGK